MKDTVDLWMGSGGEGEGTGVGDKLREVSRLTSLCVAESRSIHITTDDSVSFLFMAE